LVGLAGCNGSPSDSPGKVSNTDSGSDASTTDTRVTDPDDVDQSVDVDQTNDAQDTSTGDAVDGDNDAADVDQQDDTSAEDTDGADAGPTLPPWADHRVTIYVKDTPDAKRADYNLVVSGRIEAVGEDETFNGGRFGVTQSSVWPSFQDEFFVSGRVLSIKARPSMVEEGVWDLADSNIVVRIDGQRVNHESFDPSNGDLAYGFMGFGNLPADMRVKRSDCDHEVSSRSQLVNRLTNAGSGDTICVIGEIRLPEGPGTGIEISADEVTVAGFPASDGTSPKLYRRDHGDWGYGNVALQFTGDRVVVHDLEIEGPGVTDWPASGPIPPSRVANYEMRGIEFTGKDSFVLNVDVHHFSHANISGRGLGLTVLCVDSHHPWPSGRSYGVATGGPLTQSRDYPGEVWPDDLLKNNYTRWHERTEMRRVLLEGGRHDAEGGTHGTYSLDQFIIGPRGVDGGRIDMHRPGGGVWRIGHGAIYPHARSGPDIWMRGWPEIGWRVHDVWFANGNAPDLNERYPNGSAPIVQVCATQETRIRREVWDTSNDPFVNFETRGCMFGTGHPSDIDPELGYYYDNLDNFLGKPSQVFGTSP
jgi:hypothetical protein